VPYRRELVDEAPHDPDPVLVLWESVVLLGRREINHRTHVQFVCQIDPRDSIALARRLLPRLDLSHDRLGGLDGAEARSEPRLETRESERNDPHGDHSLALSKPGERLFKPEPIVDSRHQHDLHVEVDATLDELVEARESRVVLRADEHAPDLGRDSVQRHV